ncbi:hypothetical protein CBW65_00480 [Tumebacillus avium]|uniref:Single-stranded DNA-binding protein n=1 Tax=Tumebacillus avium TaxID=1903704 RepID=A0A1Y0IJJ2_9BACL|nr:hypothetical protein [Tumebacillus avium]ARU59685.1 hypothetical protein CBW65_00480 [Tumebacillus avium]
MNETLVHVDGVLASDPMPYQSVEEDAEVYLVKLVLHAPLQAGDLELTELFLNLGQSDHGLKSGDPVTATGTVAERSMITRSGKIRRGGVYQLLVQDVQR